jgi:twitching motility protein PilJ
MSEVKQTIFRLPRVRLPRNETLESARVGAQPLDNVAVVWKIGVIAAILALGTFVLLLTSRAGLGVLTYQVDNIYNFMLIPITSLQDARIRSIETVRTLDALNIAETAQDEQQRASVIEQAQEYVKFINGILDKYSKDWVTTISPDFTATLRQAGKLELQKTEVLQLSELNALNKRMNEGLERFAKAKTVDPVALADLTGGYFEISDRLQDLVDLNNQYADLSAKDAFAASNRANLSTILAFVISLGIGVALVVFVARSITSRLSKLERGAQALRSGDLNIQVDVAGRDEIGTVGTTLNASIAQLRDFVQQQEQERMKGIQLQQNVSQFLDVAMKIAQGDLTQKGNVSEDALGNVVDAINVMTEEIGYLLKDVQQTASQVSSSAATMTATSQGILSEAQTQANIADVAQSQTAKVTESIRQLALTAERGAQTAKETLDASTEGQRAVTNTQAQLLSLRSEMSNIASGAQSLQQRSGEISEVVRTISRFASQTNLLALGASLEAAGAGEAGARFAAVANAVRGLADESAKAATRVTQLVRDVQTEITGLAQLAESGASQADAGTKVAAEAGERLRRIAELADESAIAANAISSLAVEQVQSIETVRNDVQRIAQTAQQTESDSQNGRVVAEQLSSMSENLTRSLERFRLPV